MVPKPNGNEALEKTDPFWEHDSSALMLSSLHSFYAPLPDISIVFRTAGLLLIDPSVFKSKGTLTN